LQALAQKGKKLQQTLDRHWTSACGLTCPHLLHFYLDPTIFSIAFVSTMPDHGKTPSEDSFEFIETPPAPAPPSQPPSYGVRTTAVSID
jgi:hypothetical protein